MNTRRAALLLLVLAAFCLAAGCSTDTGSPGGSPLPPGETDTATVTRTIDGDTVHLSFSDGRTETLRILGIDTPEMTLEGNDPGKFSGITDLEYLSIWGEEAAAYTNEKLTGKVVTISYDPAAGSRDTYGRLLATIILPDGTNHGEDLIRQGLARVFTPETFALKDHYLSAQEEAMDARRGVWSGGEPDGTGTGQVVIASVHYNAAGDDAANLNDEYLTIRNRGTTVADLTSWQISDADSFSYPMPPVALPPGGAIRIHAGNGTPSAGELYMDLDGPVLNNDGDTVTLLDREGTVVSTYSWA